MAGIVTAIYILSPIIERRQSYADAKNLMQIGKYSDAAAAFEKLGSYKDASDQNLEFRYLKAGELLENDQPIKAVQNYESLGNYKDASDLVSDIRNNPDDINAAAEEIRTALRNDGEEQAQQLYYDWIGGSSSKEQFISYAISGSWFSYVNLSQTYEGDRNYSSFAITFRPNGEYVSKVQEKISYGDSKKDPLSYGIFKVDPDLKEIRLIASDYNGYTNGFKYEISKSYQNGITLLMNGKPLLDSTVDLFEEYEHAAD